MQTIKKVCGQEEKLLNTRMKYCRVYVIPVYLPLRGKFVYNFWPGVIENISSCRPHPTQTNNTTCCHVRARSSIDYAVHFLFPLAGLVSHLQTMWHASLPMSNTLNNGGVLGVVWGGGVQSWRLVKCHTIREECWASPSDSSSLQKVV
jgi:hypothetical protein